LQTELRNDDLGYGKYCSLHGSLLGHIHGSDMYTAVSDTWAFRVCYSVQK